MAPDDDDLGSAPTSSPESAASAPAAAAEPARSTTAFRTVDVGSTLGRYEVVELLGEGGMATVYRARDRELRRDVAVKVLFPHLARRAEVVRRFDREARAAAALDHPNILRVYDVGGGVPGGEPPYIVMELVRGSSLKEAVEAGGPMLAELCACAGALLADALAAAHAAGVIHRDVKPANVMVASGGRLQLADFGVARVEDDDSLVTRTGALLGTPAFMSPEQATGADIDARSDVYSLGATLYQLATGVLPHSGSAARVVAAIASGELVPPVRRRPAIGVDLSRLIERMMATDPEGRPATAAAAAAELRRIVADAGLGDPADELAAYFADPAGYTAERTPVVVRNLADRARAARAAGKLPRAIALIDRASVLAPDDPAIRTLVDELATRRGGRWLVLAGVGTVALAVVGTVVVLRSMNDARSAASDAATAVDARSAASDASIQTARPDAAVTPDAATVIAHARVDARIAVARVDARTATAGVVRAADAATAVAFATADAPPAPLAAVDARPAPAPRTSLTIIMDSWCDLSIDGTSHGRVDAKAKTITVTPGDHDVACVKKGVGTAWRKRVHVAAGTTEVVRGQLLAKVTVTIATARGVVIDGTSYRRGDTVTLTPGRHRIGTGDTSYLDVPRVAACTLKDTQDPDRPVDCYP
jgi:predicted Ser/Thr protein kinase